MGVIAVQSRNGGAGKTTLVVNLGWASACLAGHRTLIWDLDPQATATFMLLSEAEETPRFGSALIFDVGISQFVRRTAISNLDILPSDASLRSVNAIGGADRRGRLKILIKQIRHSYSRVIIDCPPGLSVVNDEIQRVVDLMIVPMLPSVVSLRALAALEEQLRAAGDACPSIMPVFTMVDDRRASHRNHTAQYPGFPSIPLTEAAELMCGRKAPIGVLAPESDETRAYGMLWADVENRLANLKNRYDVLLVTSQTA